MSMTHSYIDFISRIITDDPDILETPVYPVDVSNGMPILSKNDIEAEVSKSSSTEDNKKKK